MVNIVRLDIIVIFNCCDMEIVEYRNYSLLASLSFDNLSSEHFVGFWLPIKLKLTPSTIHYKSGMGKNAVFVLETLQQLNVYESLSRVLVSCHTKELAFQFSKKYEGFRKFMPSMKVSRQKRAHITETQLNGGSIADKVD